MKKIEFGYSNDQVPHGSWEGIGIREGVFITDGEYLGSFECDTNHYIVSNVEIPKVGNRLIVRQALCDLYADGSVQLYLNQDENHISRDIEEYINRNGVKENIKSVEDVIKLSNGLHPSYKSFMLLETDNTIIATSILPDVFNEKNDAIKYNQRSISDLSIERNNSFSR